MKRRKRLPTIQCALCEARLPKSLDRLFCSTCWTVEKVCRAEEVSRLADLADPCRSRAALLWRASDLIRRTGVEDAEVVVRALERNL